MDEYNEVHLGDDDEEVTFELLNSTDNLLSFTTSSPSSTTGKSPRCGGRKSPWTSSCIARLFCLFIMLLVAIGFAISAMPCLKAADHDGSHHQHNSHNNEEIYRKAAVAASIGECSEIGVDIMKEGGTAADGAIASMLCQGVVEPHNSGIGGGFYMVYYNANDGSSTVINARETVPSTNSSSKIATPGFLKGISYVYEKYGRGVAWAKLFEPSIKLARDGYKIGDELARVLQENSEQILTTPELCQLYCDATHRGGVKTSGDDVINAKLADTLATISEKSTDSFYSGELLVRLINNLPSQHFSFDDFRKYSVRETPTLKVPLPHAAAASNDVIKMHVTSSPSGGPVLAAIMSLVDGYVMNVTSSRAHPARCWHRVVESFKHAWGFACDVIHGTADVSDYLSEASLQQVRRTIDSMTSSSSSSSSSYSQSSSNASSMMTSSYGDHVSVLGRNGDAVSVTSSVGSQWGSFVMCNVTGILFNNALDFHIKSKSGDEVIQSYMAPCIVTNNNRSYFIIGSSGGTHSPTSTASALIRLLYMGYDDPDEAIKLPLLHNQLTPTSDLFHESNFDQHILHELSEMGHKLHLMNSTCSHTNAVKNHVSHIHAYSDIRNPNAQADGW